MIKIINFSGLFDTDTGLKGNCWVSYNYEKINRSNAWNVCYVVSTIFITNDSMHVKHEVWDEQKTSANTSISEGMIFVEKCLKQIDSRISHCNFKISNENYFIENNGKRAYITKDFANKIQYKQFFTDTAILPQEEQLSINILLDDIEKNL
jgi:hypothetical protein